MDSCALNKKSFFFWVMFPERFGDGDTSQAALELEEVFSCFFCGT